MQSTKPDQPKSFVGLLRPMFASTSSHTFPRTYDVEVIHRGVVLKHATPVRVMLRAEKTFVPLYLAPAASQQYTRTPWPPILHLGQYAPVATSTSTGRYQPRGSSYQSAPKANARILSCEPQPFPLSWGWDGGYAHVFRWIFTKVKFEVEAKMKRKMNKKGSGARRPRHGVEEMVDLLGRLSTTLHWFETPPGDGSGSGAAGSRWRWLPVYLCLEQALLYYQEDEHVRPWIKAVLTDSRLQALWVLYAQPALLALYPMQMLQFLGSHELRTLVQMYHHHQAQLLFPCTPTPDQIRQSCPRGTHWTPSTTGLDEIQLAYLWLIMFRQVRVRLSHVVEWHGSATRAAHTLEPYFLDAETESISVTRLQAWALQQLLLQMREGSGHTAWPLHGVTVDGGSRVIQRLGPRVAGQRGTQSLIVGGEGHAYRTLVSAYQQVARSMAGPSFTCPPCAARHVPPASATTSRTPLPSPCLHFFLPSRTFDWQPIIRYMAEHGMIYSIGVSAAAPAYALAVDWALERHLADCIWGLLPSIATRRGQLLPAPPGKAADQTESSEPPPAKRSRKQTVATEEKAKAGVEQSSPRVRAPFVDRLHTRQNAAVDMMWNPLDTRRVLACVSGGPGCGKTTLLQSLGYRNEKWGEFKDLLQKADYLYLTPTNAAANLLRRPDAKQQPASATAEGDCEEEAPESKDAMPTETKRSLQPMDDEDSKPATGRNSVHSVAWFLQYVRNNHDRAKDRWSDVRLVIIDEASMLCTAQFGEMLHWLCYSPRTSELQQEPRAQDQSSDPPADPSATSRPLWKAMHDARDAAPPPQATHAPALAHGGGGSGLFPRLQRLVLVGDKDQLPPVEAGFPFQTLYSAGTSVPRTHLDHNFRLADTNNQLAQTYHHLAMHGTWKVPKSSSTLQSKVRPAHPSPKAAQMYARQMLFNRDTLTYQPFGEKDATTLAMAFFIGVRTPAKVQIVTRTHRVKDYLNTVVLDYFIHTKLKLVGHPRLWHNRGEAITSNYGSRRLGNGGGQRAVSPGEWPMHRIYLGEKVKTRQEFTLRLGTRRQDGVRAFEKHEYFVVTKVEDRPRAGYGNTSSTGDLWTETKSSWLPKGQEPRDVRVTLTSVRDGKPPVTLVWNSFNYSKFERAFAATVHSVQGQEMDYCLVVLDGNCTRSLLYTAMSRAQKGCGIFALEKHHSDRLFPHLCFTPPRDDTTGQIVADEAARMTFYLEQVVANTSDVCRDTVLARQVRQQQRSLNDKTRTS